MFSYGAPDNDSKPPSYCYLVSGRIIKSKLCSGYRRLMFDDGQRSHACYDFRNPGHSIWYPDESNDLHISLLFEEKEDALHFIGQLANYQVFKRFRFGLTFEREPLLISMSAQQMTQLQHILITDYIQVDSDSPANSYSDSILSEETSFDGFDPDKRFRSLEDFSQLAYRESIFRCHIAPKAHYPDYIDNTDNILFGSNLFHTYFDGDGKIPPPEANIDWGTPPNLLVEFVEARNELQIAGKTYVKIFVKVIFRDPLCAKAMDTKWREGYTVESELITCTHFYAQNVDTVKACLRRRAFETRRRWAHCDGEIVDFTEDYMECISVTMS